MQFHCIRMRYSIESEDRIYVKGYGFLSFAKNMSKNLSTKYSQKLLDSVKKSGSKRAFQKTLEATGDLIGNKITYKITSISRRSSAELRSKNNDANSNMEVPKGDTYLQKKCNILLMN